MWKLFFKKKEKTMATTTESRTATQLKKTVQEQKKTISTILTRISALADEYLTGRVDG
jgi:predicted solute-binding protein